MKIVLIIIFSFMTLYGFTSKNYKITENGRLQHRIDRTYLCVDENRHFKKCEEGQTLFVAIAENDGLPIILVMPII